MSKKLLTAEQAEMVHKLREKVDSWGDPVYTGREIAEEMGVSEATIWRVLNRQAGYAVAKRRERNSAAYMDAVVEDKLGIAKKVELPPDFAAMEARLVATQKAHDEQEPKSSLEELFAKRALSITARVMPPDPLDE